MLFLTDYQTRVLQSIEANAQRPANWAEPSTELTHCRSDRAELLKIVAELLAELDELSRYVPDADINVALQAVWRRADHALIERARSRSVGR